MREGLPPSDHYIGDLVLARAYVFEDQFFAGWTVLILKDHRTELFQLTGDERAELVEEVSQAGEALTEIFNVEKINSELLGFAKQYLPRIRAKIYVRLGRSEGVQPEA